MRKDQDGEFWHIVAGAAIGAGVEIASQLISGKKFSEIRWGAVGISAGAGAVTAAAGPAAGMVASGFGAGAADYVKEKNVKSAAAACVVGGVASKIGYKVKTKSLIKEIKGLSGKSLKYKKNKVVGLTKSWLHRNFGVKKSKRYFKYRYKKGISAFWGGHAQGGYGFYDSLKKNKKR